MSASEHRRHAPRLADVDPDSTPGLNRDEASERLEALGEEFAELEDLLYFAGLHSLLIVLQGRDTSGKDGAIRRILQYSNAQGVRVEPFKVPTEEERAHDFLWRVHAKVPRLGYCVIFNRSHYEDVLVPLVHGYASEEVIRKRYDHIRDFEELLTANGTLLLKFFLHITREEQEQRLLDREKETEKAWKLSAGDWREREHWDAYTKAYDRAITECSTPKCPWHVVPANHKWYRDVVIMEAIVAALREKKAEWMAALEATGVRARKELAEYRARPQAPKAAAE